MRRALAALTRLVPQSWLRALRALTRRVPQSLPRAVAALVGLGLATAAFYPEIAFTGRILAEYDVWAYFYPLRQYAASALTGGRFPLWNPDTFLGAPFFANPQTALLYPGTALFMGMPVPDAYSASVLLHVFLTAAAAYAFMRVVLGVRAWAGLIGAVAFALGGSVSAQVGHINQLSATPWLLSVAVCADLAFRRRSPRWAAAGSGALGIQLLAGHAQITYMTLWVVGMLLVWRAVDEVWSWAPDPEQEPGPSRLARWGPALRALVVLGLVVLPGVALAAAQLVPTAELSRLSVRSGGLPYAEAVAFSLPPNQIFRALLPGYWTNVFSEFMGYIGIVPLFLAMLGLAFAPGSRVVFAAGTAAVGLVLAFGGANPLYAALHGAVPGMDWFRVPARWLLVYSLGGASLAALGSDWILTRPMPAPSIWRPPLVLGAVSLAAVVFTELLNDVAARIVVLWTCSFLAAGILGLLALRRPGRALAALLLLGSLAELRAAAAELPARNPVPIEAYTAGREVPGYLSRDLSGRVLSIAPTEYEVPDSRALAARHPDLRPAALFAFKTALKLDEVMSPNVPLRFGLSTVDGYDGGVLPLSRYLDLASLLVPRSELRADGVLRTRLLAVPERPLLDFFGVRAVIANQVNDVELDGLRYDTSTARRLGPGKAVAVDLPTSMDVREVAMLASAEPLPAQPPGRQVGVLVLDREDGSRDEVPLVLGRQVFAFGEPGAVHTSRRVSQPGQTGGEDTSVRIPVAVGAPLVRLTWRSDGAVVWELRGAIVLRADGQQEQLPLVPGLRRTLFPVLVVHENATPQPAVLDLVPRAEPMDDVTAVNGLLADPDSARQVVRLEPAAEPRSEVAVGRGQFTRIGGSPERLVFQRVGGGGSGYLVVDDAWFPGWRAWVDDEEVPVHRANVLFKALWVDAGAQQVVLSYEPLSIKLGVAISVLGLEVMVALFVLGLTGRRL